MSNNLSAVKDLITRLRAVRETINVSLGGDPVRRGHVQDAQRMLDALIPDIAFQFGDVMAKLVDRMSDDELRADMIARGEDPDAAVDELQAMARKILNAGAEEAAAVQ